MVEDAVMGEGGVGGLFRSDLDLDRFLPYLRLLGVWGEMVSFVSCICLE